MDAESGAHAGGQDGDGRMIPESVFADDDGSADARLAQALIRHGSGKASREDVVDALAYARVLVPVLAEGTERRVGRHGLEQDEVAATGVVAIELPDGRAALPVFTDVEAMRVWKAQARPVPVEGPRAALAAVAEGWAALVVNPSLETVVIPRPAVWALAQGRPWRPAVRDGVLDPEVRQAVLDVIVPAGDLRGVDAGPGNGAEVAVTLDLAPGLSQAEVDAVVVQANAALASSDVVTERVDSLELRLR